MFHFRIYEHESLYGLVYMFPNAGDGIPLHNHIEEQKHNVIVLKGSLEIYGPDRNWVKVLKAGDIFDILDEHHPHEICALEPNTVSLGLFVHGKPESDRFLSEDDMSGMVHKPLMYPPRFDMKSDTSV